jgi:4-amino-4-deoxy-L-arabinose transferase-like glycosyltransferase
VSVDRGGEQRAGTRLAPAEDTLGRRPDQIALVIVALGLTARLLAARLPFLTPDDVEHLSIASGPGLLDVYRASLGAAHPPLFFLLLHFWKTVAGPEWALRLLPVAFGTAFLWAAYRWVSTLFGRAAALCALVLSAFLPSLVIVSGEIRSYTLLLWLAAASLAALERAFREESPGGLALFGVLAALGALTHYSALFLIASAFAYTAVRIGMRRPPRRFVRAWAACQALLAALVVLLYTTHIAALRGGALERLAQDDWLKASYFRAGQESVLGFCARQTVALFQYLMSSRSAGLVGIALLLGAIVWLAARRQPSAILIAIPFALVMTAGVLVLYPYGGSRHSFVLAPFAVAGIGLALARLSSERLWLPIGLAVVLGPAGFLAVW